MAKNNKTRFFYVLYSDKTRVFDQSERAYYPIYIIIKNKFIALRRLWSLAETVTVSSFWLIRLLSLSLLLHESKYFMTFQVSNEVSHDQYELVGTEVTGTWQVTSVFRTAMPTNAMTSRINVMSQDSTRNQERTKR